jgi:hypothetical protein
LEAKNRKLKIGALLSLLLLVALLIGILVLKNSTEPRVVYALQNKEADPNQQPEQKQKDPNDKKLAWADD